MIVDLPLFQLRIRFPFAAIITLMLVFSDEKIVLMSLFSSLIHESGHLLLMLFFGDRINYIELGVFGMRIEKEGTLLSYKKEALTAMGGIILNVISLLLSLSVFFITKKDGFLLFAAVNGFVALINMLPVRILDFGRCLKCLLNEKYSEEKSDRIMMLLSAAFTVVFSTVCIIYCIFVSLNFSFIAVSLYLNIITFKKKWS